MECLRCKTSMKKGFPNIKCEILTAPRESNIVIDGKVAYPKSVFVCPRCGYIEFSNKEFNEKEQGYEVDI